MTHCEKCISRSSEQYIQSVNLDEDENFPQNMIALDANVGNEESDSEENDAVYNENKNDANNNEINMKMVSETQSNRNDESTANQLNNTNINYSSGIYLTETLNDNTILSTNTNTHNGANEEEEKKN
jgi:hypothetical protein